MFKKNITNSISNTVCVMCKHCPVHFQQKQKQLGYTQQQNIKTNGKCDNDDKEEATLWWNTDCTT